MAERQRKLTPATLPGEIPVFPLPGAMLLPGGQLPLNIFEPRYLNMVEDALSADRIIGMIQPVAEKDERMLGDGVVLYNIGCAGRLTQFMETDDGRYVITLTGVVRFRIAEELDMRDGYRRVRADYTPFIGDITEAGSRETVAVNGRDRLVTAMARYFAIKGIEADMSNIDEAPDALLVDTLAMTCPLEPGEKQALLECPDTQERAELLTSMFEIAAHEGGAGTHDLQ
ncbi:MAG: LON peptidase substrate-binding domain-containing protein [Rhodospirillales bacterium]|nr:LON peptidase substrate-binding domain-containing protein [Rhodospirillales bacterium]MBO6787660.1 LON peptidase substrate-binding domain-containing protein [Rhodospirillales bacterium]